MFHLSGVSVSVPTCHGHSPDVQLIPSKLFCLLVAILFSHCVSVLILPQGNLTEGEEEPPTHTFSCENSAIITPRVCMHVCKYIPVGTHLVLSELLIFHP